MKHEQKREWVKPELKAISSAKNRETVLLVSVQQGGNQQQPDPNQTN